MRPVLGRMGKTSDNQGVDYFWERVNASGTHVRRFAVLYGLTNR